MPSHLVGLIQHWPTHCHSQLGLGVTVWHPGHLSFHVDPRVLLQHAWTGYFCTSFSFSRLRYAHSGHTRYCIQGAPPRVEYPDYPSCEHLRTVSKDEMISAFCERPIDLGNRQFTPCSTFAKGPRFMNMVITFVLHLLSNYNSITEPRTRFLLSFLEHLIIDFPSHFILSIIDVYRDTMTHDKLIFPSAITRILCHFSIPFPSSDHFHVICAIDYATVKRSEAQFCSRRSGLAAPPTPSATSTSTPSTSAGGVILDAIMAQLQRMDACLDTLSTELYQMNTCVDRIARR